MTLASLRRAAVLCLAGAGTVQCGGVPAKVPWVEDRTPCLDYNEERNLYFGDLHVHTGWSFDAWNSDVRLDPMDAYRYAKGEEVALPPLDSNGVGTTIVSNPRPLDFAAVTEHAEFLAEVQACQDPASIAYDSETCITFRLGGPDALVPWGIALGSSAPVRFGDVCGDGAEDCETLASDVWSQIQDINEQFYDRSEVCEFTSFVAYEWSGTSNLANLHRNLIFQSERVPEIPLSHYESPTVSELLGGLESACRDGLDGCDFLSIPHNTNWSNGNLFVPETTDDEEATARARLRARNEPLLEIFQHKGDAECSNGFDTVDAPADEFCDFEKLRRVPFTDCGDGTGLNGIVGQGCVSRRDFLRGILNSGLEQWNLFGFNPFRVGVVAATDTHNGTPGRVAEETYVGHFGSREIDAPGRLQAAVPSGPRNSPGGLIAVWAEENSRGPLFEAMQRREVYGTSGPRMAVRVFAGPDVPDDLCAGGNFVARGDASGVPMGGELAATPGDDMKIAVLAERDIGTDSSPGRGLERVQIVKGWLDDQGEPRVEVFDAAVTDAPGSVDETTCEVAGQGSDTLCTVWTDDAYDPTRPAWYYAKVLELPVCRWSWRDCLSLPEAERPEVCDDPETQRTIRERAWTSPVWSTPSY